MMRAVPLLTGAALSACGAAPPVPANACRGGVVAPLVGRNVGEVRFAPGLPHRVLIPGSEAQPVAAGTLLLRVDDKGWITEAGCVR